MTRGAVGGTPAQPGGAGPWVDGLVVVPYGLRFDQLMVGVRAVVGAVLVGAPKTLVGLVGVVVVVWCTQAPGVVVVGVPIAVPVEVLRHKHILGSSFSLSSFTFHFQLL